MYLQIGTFLYAFKEAFQSASIQISGFQHLQARQGGDSLYGGIS